MGDRVAALTHFGGHATHIVLPYEQLLKIEKTDDPVKLVALPLNYMTAWGMLKHSGVDLKPGSSILIGSASGGLGTAMAQLVTSFNMGIKMIGTTSASKFEYVRSLGIEPIDRNAPDLVEQVKVLTGGTGVDVAYDAICTEDSINKSLAATKAHVGNVVVVGIMGNIAQDGSGMLEATRKVQAERLQHPSVNFWRLDCDFPIKEAGRAEFYSIVDKVRSGELQPIIAGLLKLEDGVKAHEMLIDASQIKGKLVFVVDAELAAENGL